MAKIIRLSAPGASGAAGGGTTPAALQISFVGPTGTVGAAYSGALVAGGGVTPFTFSISGALPPGLSLNPSTGAITGTPTTPGTYSFTGQVTDNVATVATVACSIVIPNAAAAEYIGGVTALTAAEVANSVYQDSNGGLHMVVSLNPTISATQFPVRVRCWIDYDDGKGWILQGDRYADTATPAFTFGDQQQETGLTIAGTIWVPTDPAKIHWKAACEANGHAAQPSGSATTYSFTVTPAQAVPTTDITNIHFVPNATTGDLITYALADAGVYYWIWNELDYTQPCTSAAVAGGDPYFKSSFCVTQLGYAVTGTGTLTGGNALQSTGGAAFAASDVGNLIHVGNALVRIASYVDSTHVTVTTTSLNGNALANGAGQLYEVWRPAPADSVNGVYGADDPDAQAQGYWGRRFTDGPPPSAIGATTAQFIGQPSWPIPPLTLPDGTTNLYRTFRHWVFGVSRLADNEAGGVETVTLQGGWTGGADHYDLVPAQQAAALDLTRTKASTLGRGMGKESGTGRVQVNTSGALAVDGSNNLYVAISNDFVVSGGQITQNIVNLAKAVNFGTEFANNTGTFVVNAIAVNKLVAGDALFAGQATFATVGGGKVIINSSGVTIQNAVTSPTASVTLSASGVVIGGPSGSLTADSSGISITNGSSSVTVTASAVTIVNGTLTAPVISGGSLSITTFAGGVTISSASSGVSCTNGGWSANYQASGWSVSGPLSQGVSAQPGQVSVSSGGVTSTLRWDSLVVGSLPSSNPGAGSKMFWYDPADGNRLKYAA